MNGEDPEGRLARKLGHVRDGCRELDAAIERCGARRLPWRVVVVLDVDASGAVVASEVFKRFERR